MGSSTSIKILTFLPSILNNPRERRLKKQLKSVGTWTVIQNPLIGIFKCCLLLKNSLEDGHHIFLFCYLVDALWIRLVDMFYFSIFPIDILKFCYSVLLCVVWENNASIKKNVPCILHFKFYTIYGVSLFQVCYILQLFFSSFNVDDEDYNGYEYSLLGKLSEVRVVYLNRFIQEVIFTLIIIFPCFTWFYNS